MFSVVGHLTGKCSGPYIIRSEGRPWLVGFVSMVQFHRDYGAQDILRATKGEVLTLSLLPSRLVSHSSKVMGRETGERYRAVPARLSLNKSSTPELMSNS